MDYKKMFRKALKFAKQLKDIEESLNKSNMRTPLQISLNATPNKPFSTSQFSVSSQLNCKIDLAQIDTSTFDLNKSITNEQSTETLYANLLIQELVQIKHVLIKKQKSNVCECCKLKMNNNKILKCHLYNDLIEKIYKKIAKKARKNDKQIKNNLLSTENLNYKKNGSIGNYDQENIDPLVTSKIYKAIKTRNMTLKENMDKNIIKTKIVNISGEISPKIINSDFKQQKTDVGSHEYVNILDKPSTKKRNHCNKVYEKASKVLKSSETHLNIFHYNQMVHHSEKVQENDLSIISNVGKSELDQQQHDNLLIKRKKNKKSRVLETENDQIINVPEIDLSIISNVDKSELEQQHDNLSIKKKKNKQSKVLETENDQIINAPEIDLSFISNVDKSVIDQQHDNLLIKRKKNKQSKVLETENDQIINVPEIDLSIISNVDKPEFDQQHLSIKKKKNKQSKVLETENDQIINVPDFDLSMSSNVDKSELVQQHENLLIKRKKNKKSKVLETENDKIINVPEIDLSIISNVDKSKNNLSIKKKENKKSKVDKSKVGQHKYDNLLITRKKNTKSEVLVPKNDLLIPNVEKSNVKKKSVHFMIEEGKNTLTSKTDEPENDIHNITKPESTKWINLNSTCVKPAPKEPFECLHVDISEIRPPIDENKLIADVCKRVELWKEYGTPWINDFAAVHNPVTWEKVEHVDFETSSTESVKPKKSKGTTYVLDLTALAPWQPSLYESSLSFPEV